MYHMILDTLVEDPNHTGLQMYNPLDSVVFFVVVRPVIKRGFTCLLIKEDSLAI